MKRIKHILKKIFHHAKPTRMRRNPGLYCEIKNKHIKHSCLTKDEFLEVENKSYGNDLGDSCVPADSEVIHNIRNSYK